MVSTRIPAACHIAVIAATACLALGALALGLLAAFGSSSRAPGCIQVTFASTVGGALNATGAEAVQLVGTRINGAAQIRNSAEDVTIAGSTFNGGLALTGNTQVTANERYTRLAGPYGPLLVGNHISGDLSCSGNSAPVKDFGAPNSVRGAKAGDCAQL